VLSKTARDKTVPDLGAGDAVQLFLAGRPTTWRIVGVAQSADSGGGVNATAEGLAAATGAPQQVNRIRLITGEHDESTRQSAADRVDDALTAAGVDVAAAASVSRGTAAGSAHLGPVLLVLLAVALPLGLIGGIGLAATTSANVLDRIREFAVMHAIGGRPATVRRIVAVEAVLLALTSCLVAAVPTVILTALLGNGLGNLFGNAALPFRVSALAVVLWIALAVLGAVLATDAAAVRASRITVREAISRL
jgi:putative ABC transport system permease protein